MSWKQDPSARLKIIAAMRSIKGPATPREISTIVGKDPSSVFQTLVSLCTDRVVCKAGHKMLGTRRRAGAWKLTGNPVPKVFTSARALIDTKPPTAFDDRALTAALGMDRVPAVVRASVVHRAE